MTLSLRREDPLVMSLPPLPPRLPKDLLVDPVEGRNRDR